MIGSQTDFLFAKPDYLYVYVVGRRNLVEKSKRNMSLWKEDQSRYDCYMISSLSNISANAVITLRSIG